MPGPGEVELTPCGSVCWRQERGLGGRRPGMGLLQGAPGMREMLKAACQPRQGSTGSAASLGGPASAQLSSPGHIWIPADLDHICLAKVVLLLVLGASLQLRQQRICLQCRRPGSIPGLGRSPGEGHGNPLQYSCLENPMDRGPWWVDYSPQGHKEWDMTEQLTV